MLDPSMTPQKVAKSKRIRLRRERLAMAKARGEEEVNFTDVKQLSEKVEKMSMQLDMLTCNMHSPMYDQSLDWQAATSIDAAPMMSMPATPPRNPSDLEIQRQIDEAVASAKQRAHADLQNVCADEVEEDMYDTLYCKACEKIADMCTCSKPALVTLNCQECDSEVAYDGWTTHELEQQLSAGVQLEPCLTSMKCPACKVGVLTKSMNILDAKDVCETCFGINEQHDIHPCEADCESQEHMHHAQCMHRVAHPEHNEEAYVCADCFRKGRLPKFEASSGDDEQDDADDEGEEEKSREGCSEDGYSTVQAHGLLKVGDPYGQGEILEIYPRINKVTMQIARNDGVEIQHLKIDKVEEKVCERMSKQTTSAMDTMDWQKG